MRFDFTDLPVFVRNLGLVLFAGSVLQGAFEMWDAIVYTVCIAGSVLIVASFVRR